MTGAVCAVALPLPAAEPYRYTVSTALLDRVAPGSRVVVPVRSRSMVGVVVAVDADASTDDLKSVLLAPDAYPLLTDEMLAVAGWMSRYYATPIGLVLRSMLPAALWGASTLAATLTGTPAPAGGVSADVVQALEQAGGRATATSLRRRLRRPVWDVLQRLERAGVVHVEVVPPKLGPAPRTERVVRLTRALPTLLERDAVFGRARRQRDAYEALDAIGGVAPAAHLTGELGFSAAVLRGLVERDVACIESVERPRDPLADARAEHPPTPSAPQRDAVEAVGRLEPGSGALLFGVTGSGKTLVYLEAIKQQIESGGGAIVLVPEIALTPQTIARVRGVFGDAVAVLHSALSDGERADAWRELVRGERRVVVGARSAVFAPVRDLRVVVVDEEHDGSYKHGERPRYHARDVALRRARAAGARVILGSATPSMETWAARDRITVLTLPARATAQPLPPVELVDLRAAERRADAGPIPWSTTLDVTVEGALDRGEQVLLLLNRRGYANFLQCPECGTVCDCPSCSISLTVHRTPPRLRCHYCGHDQPIPRDCPECGTAIARVRGVGTQRLERWVAERYPSARVGRMDADTTSRKWSHQRILDAVRLGEIDVLLGTQMIAKGLDFPNVTLVGVVDADTGLHLPDFRAAERTFQLVAQVAGRAGRGPRGGRVIVQTRSPDHYALQHAAQHDVEGFAACELEQRRDPPYPPHVGLVNVGVSGEVEMDVADAAERVAAWLSGLVARHAEGAVEVIGPAPAPLARIKRRWRWHVVLRAYDRTVLGNVLRYAQTRAPHVNDARIRVTFDRDPASML
jgi:primosomal protein N' (replication factor Y)